MKKLIFFLSTLFLSVSVCSMVYATTIDYATQLDANGILTTTYAGAIVEDFDNGTMSWNGSGNGKIVTGSLAGKYADPFNSSLMKEEDALNNYYLSIPNPSSSGTYSFTFDTNYTYFGLFWGSIDDYNTISFYNNGNIIESYAGDMLPLPTTANGNQTSETSNLYVNFYDINSGIGFDEVRLSSTGYAFEVDNLAVGAAPVPEPATMFLLGIGLVGIAGLKRRRK